MSDHDDVLGESRIGKRERFSHDSPYEDDPEILEKAHSVTKIYLDIMNEDSRFFSTRSSSTTVPLFETKEVSLDKKLGQGEFGIVYSVGAFLIEEEEEESPSEGMLQTTAPRPKSQTRNGSSALQVDTKDLPSTPLCSKPSSVNSFPLSSKGSGGTMNQAMNSESSLIPKIPSKTTIGRKDSTVSFAENPVSVIVPADDVLTDDSSLSEEEDMGLGLDEDDNNNHIRKLPGPNVSKTYMRDHVIRDGSPRYAVKRLRRDLKGDKLLHATADLASEAHFLKLLRHPNICKMRGTIGLPGVNDFGIILDRLTMTLRDKMLEWKKNDKSGSLFSKLERLLRHPQSKKEEKLQVYKERYTNKLIALYDTARALRYLAKHSIVFRDLKPENLAFDYRGDVRLFDFGLAKELKDKDRIVRNKYNLTGLTGSRRYMAPEVILCKYYGLPADVYSYAVMFWEVMSNHNAYHYITYEKHFEMVVTRKKRPNLKKMIPHKEVLPEGSKIHQLVEQSWAPNPDKRPTIEHLCAMLEEEVREASDDERESLKAMDRTTFLVNQSLRSRAEVQ